MPDMISLAMSIAPELGPVLASPSVQAAAVEALHAVTGTEDEAGAQKVLASDPQKAIDLRARLAEIAAAAQETQRQADRQALAALVRQPARSPGPQVRPGDRWGAPVVSVVVLVSFGTVMWVAMTRALPTGSETIVNMLLGTMAAMATSVVAYWVGSSAGSAAKTDLLFRNRADGADKS
jgi:hypothetical protein